MRVFSNQDQEVRHSVVKALDYEPTVHREHIAVRVEDGVVTLGGKVASYNEKHHAI